MSATSDQIHRRRSVNPQQDFDQKADKFFYAAIATLFICLLAMASKGML